MFADAGNQQFAKQTPGADMEFLPAGLDEYAADPWDIRISLGDAPLDEAFYFTVDDPSAVGLTMEELLDRYALNPALKDQLDVAEYPDLPFIQDELIQYRRNAQLERISLQYFINYNPTPGPVSLSEIAADYLCTCTYHDGSNDYRVLDIVIVPEVTPLTEAAIAQARTEYGDIFLVMLLNFYICAGEQEWEQFLAEPAMASFLSRWPVEQYRVFTDAMSRLEQSGLIRKIVANDAGGENAGVGCDVEFTDAGMNLLEDLKVEFIQDAERYDVYDSVAVAPPALGVPDGFDVRVQMMEFDGIDVCRAVLVQVLGDGQQEWFAPGQWYENFVNFIPMHVVHDALAYTTGFSSEVLVALKELAGDR